MTDLILIGLTVVLVALAVAQLAVSVYAARQQQQDSTKP